MAEKQMKLRVGELTDRDDFGRGIARIDSRMMQQIGVKEGEIIEIEGTRKSAAVAIRAYPVDIGMPFIRIDGLVRKNCGTGIGEIIMIRKASVKEGRRVVFTPAERGVFLHVSPSLLKQNLFMRPVVKGDIVAAIPAFRRSSEADDDFGEEPMEVMDIFKEFFNLPHEVFFPFGTDVKLIVVESEPSGTIQITDNTRVELLNEVDRRKIPGFTPAEMRGLHEEAKEVKEIRQVPLVTYEDIGGIQDAVKKVREMIELPLRHPELFERLGVEPPKGVLLYGPPGCLTGDALVALEDGKLVRIGELGKNLVPGIYIADLPVYPPAHAKAIHVYDVPETIEVITKSGKRLKMTPNHPLMTDKGWVEAEKLNNGDNVKIFNWLPNPQSYIPTNFILNKKRLINEIKVPKIWDENLAELAGIFVAEGSIDAGRIKFTIHRDESDLRGRIISLMSEMFGADFTERVLKDKACRKIRFASRGVWDFFKLLWTKEKMIPQEILLSPNIVAAGFLRGLFEGDGSVVKKNRHFDRAITLKSKSRKLLEEVQVLLLRWSVRSSIYQSDSENSVGHVLKIRGKENLRKFKENIGFISKEKTEKLNLQLSTYKRKTPNEDAEFEPIREVRKIKGWERVYDFEVPTTHAFFSNGILSHNTGKTLLAKAVANEAGAHFISLAGPEIMSKWYGQSEENLRKVFEEAQKNAPAIIFIDEIDAIAPKREEVTGEVERRVVSQLLTLMDGLKSRGKVIVLAATNRPNALDEALRRPGRFDREIDIGVPDKNGRKEILKIHTRNMPLSEDVNLEELAEKTYGYVGADLAALSREAAMSVIRRNMEEIKSKEEYLPKITEVSREYNIRSQKDLLNAIKTVSEKLQKSEKDAAKAKPIFGKKTSIKEDDEENGEQDETKNLSETLSALEIIKRLYVSMNDFNNAFLFVQPSAMREIMIEVPKVKWSDVGGLDEVKNALKEAVEWPLHNAESFKRLGIKPARGIMLYGPPGCGKTYIVKAVANEAGVNFIAVKGPEIMSKWVGESEENIRKIFRKAKQVSPAIIFFDEMDAIAPRRGQGAGNRVSEQIVSQILTEMSGIEDIEGVAVIAASVTGDTPIMIKDKNGARIVPISEFVDTYYVDEEEGTEKPVYGVKCLGFDENNNMSKFSSGLRFGKSNFKNVRGVFRHKVNEIYEINFIGGSVHTTGNHSVFVRTRKGIEAKPVSELNAGEFLVDLPYSVRGKNVKDIRAHDFMKNFNLELPIFLPDIKLEDEYDFSIKASMPQSMIASQIGFSQASVSNWRRNICLPRGLSKKYFKHALPEKITVSADLMRLFGYYVAEGYARKEIDFCFNSKEKQLMDDVKGLMKSLFGIEPDAIRSSTENAANIVYYCKPLADFLGRHCGKGAHFKHVPSFLFTAPFEYFREFLKGYAAGDGHKDKKGRIEITSVSKQLITELNWLCRMHGIKSYISQFTVSSGRRINGGKPLAAVKAYKLGFGKWSNPFSETFTPKTKRAKIKSIRKLPFNGYVYDLCGCENEAFFGGETPILLHNTNRPDIIDPALLRPGRFDKLIYVPAPDLETRKKIFEIHTKGVPVNASKIEAKELDGLFKEIFEKKINSIKYRMASGEYVSKEEIDLLGKGNDKKQKIKFEEMSDVDKFLYHLAEKAEGYSGADLEAVVREAALEAMRENMGAKEVTAKHFEEALKKIRPSITKDMFVQYQKAVEDLKKTKLEEEEKARYIG